MTHEPQKPEGRKQCFECKEWFYIGTGEWVDGWFEVKCPCCDKLLTTQTSWFELKPKGWQSSGV